MDAIARGVAYCPWPSPWSLISVHSDEEGVSGPLLTHRAVRRFKALGMVHGMTLRFEDFDDNPRVLENMRRCWYSPILFDEDMAERVVRFIEGEHGAVEGRTLVVHCDAGVSRSGAIGMFVVARCGLDGDAFLRANSYIRPNERVLRLLGVAGK
jgi:predicted protein tyrosine phosphatase